MKNIRLLFKSALFVLPLSMSAAVCDYKLSFDKSMIDFGDVSSVKKISVKLTNESIGDSCDLNVFQLYSTKQGQGVFSNSDFSGTIAQNSSIDIEVTMTPNYTDSIIKYEDSDLFVHSVGVDSDGKKHYVKSWVDYRGIELPKQSGEVINGYILPPEPNKTLNNSTLLGIDSNDNGVRDDVERYVIKRFAKDPEFPKTKTAIAMQYAWASQKILENPTIESNQYLDDVFSCQFYWFEIKTKNLPTLEAIQYAQNHEVITNPELKDKIFNTKKRIEAKFAFNAACSGHIFDGGGTDSVDRCQINIDLLGE